MITNTCPTLSSSEDLNQFERSMQNIVDGCINCYLCVKECAFLQKYGTPASICENRLSFSCIDSPVFACNLCGLCDEVCPKDLSISQTFLEIRRSMQDNSTDPPASTSRYKEHKSLCAYEKNGGSSLFSLHLLSESSDSVFFPGCTLAATRPKTTLAAFRHLRLQDPDCGVMLDCCAKPTHDMGLKIHQTAIQKITEVFDRHSIKRIITACPSCYKMFTDFAPQFKTVSIYELLAKNPPKQDGAIHETFSIHDTYITRNVPEIHDAVRALVGHRGVEIIEMKHNRENTICCGEGGAATFIAPEITQKWKSIRKKESDGQRIITYCAGCSSTLAKELPATHLLDLVFNQKKALKGEEQQSRPPFTYLNRLWLKRKLQNLR